MIDMVVCGCAVTVLLLDDSVRESAYASVIYILSLVRGFKGVLEMKQRRCFIFMELRQTEVFHVARTCLLLFCFVQVLA